MLVPTVKEAMAVDSEVNENDDDPNMPELIENV